MSFLVGFARFWWDFIVGDSVVLAIGGGSALLLGALLVDVDASRVAEVLLPVFVIAALLSSLYGQRRS